MDARISDHDAAHEEKKTSTDQRPLLPLDSRGIASESKGTNLAFLDGLRGIAALIVYFHHHITEYYGNDCDLMHAWGYQGRHSFGQLPFIQLFFAGGTPAVMIFFVLSGYVLSRGSLQMIQNGKDSSSLFKYLLNALLRRPVRLWLPPILVSLPIALAFHTPLRPVGAFIIYESNVFAELRVWFVNLVETINPLVGHGPFLQSFQYDPPVWTMAYELNGSVVVYAWLAVCAVFLSPRNRMISLAVTLFVGFEYGHFSLPPFVLGVMLAQLDVGKMDQSYIERIPTDRRPLFFNVVFALGWYLLSDVGPAVKPEKPWFGISEHYIPFFFYHNSNLATNIVGAFLMVYAALRIPWLQDILNRAKWLGKVSFALYLTHVPVLWIVAYRVARAFGKPVDAMGEKSFFDGILPIPDVGISGLTTRYLAMQLVVLPLNLGLAELVTTYIDETSVTISKRFATRIMQKLHL